MKFLIVFVSALVLVAHGDVSPSDEEDSVYAIKSEVVAGYAAQEVGGPQGVFAEEDEPRVSSSVEPESAYAEDPAAVMRAVITIILDRKNNIPVNRHDEDNYVGIERVPAPESGVYIPIDSRVCTNFACANVCKRLGFRYGICISLDTCWCYN